MRTKYKSLLLLIAISIAYIPVVTGQENADRSAAALLQRCTSAIEKSGAVQMDFTIRGQEGDLAGKITMSGNSFTMVVPGVRIWFDGRTQWTLAEEQKSVNVTEPSLEELMESNPFVILSNYTKHYKARRSEGAPAGEKRIVLTPTGKSPSGIENVSLTFSDKTGLPTEADISFDNGSEIKATVTASRNIPRPNAASFRYNPKDYPSIEIVDLR